MKELIKFHATWCGPCKSLSNIMKTIDVGMPVTECDIDDNMDQAAKYAVRGVPTVVLLEDGKEVKRFVGVKTADDIKEWLEN